MTNRVQCPNCKKTPRGDLLKHLNRCAGIKSGFRKYHNRETVVEGITFQSQREAARYLVLREMQRQGKLSGLKRQVKYELVVNKIHVCDYYADFVYNLPHGGRVIEDTKGFQTKEFKLKRKLFRAVTGLEITLT